MNYVTRYSIVLPEDRRARVAPDYRVSTPTGSARTAVVPADSSASTPNPVLVIIIDAGGPSSTFVLMDAGGPASTYPLIDGGSP